MIDDSNKGSPQNQGVTDKNPVTPKLHPLPRTFEGKEYYGASDVAKIIGVTRITVLQWHKKDCQIRGGRYFAKARDNDQMAPTIIDGLTRLVSGIRSTQSL